MDEEERFARLGPVPEGARRYKIGCGTCGGDGQCLVPRMITINGTYGTVINPEPCKMCHATGWLPYIG